MSDKLKKVIADEISRNGALSFARFMELALYHPDLGYYHRAQFEQNIGRQGDFFTSVSVGALFGKLIALQLYNWWQTFFSGNSKITILECASFNGFLARDILNSIKEEAPDFFSHVEYLIIEPSPRCREVQQKTLAEFSCVNWKSSMSEVGEFAGVVLANELLDAMPVYRVEKLPEDWIEHCVTLDESRSKFCWTKQALQNASIIKNLPQNYKGTIEVSPARHEWLTDVAAVLKAGCILLFDYGYTNEEYYQVSRPDGTIRAYREHRLQADVLSCPGEQDITAHVAWTPLLETANTLGLEISEFIQQGRWLTRIVASHSLVLQESELRQFKSLTYPDSLGEPFRTLVLHRK